MDRRSVLLAGGFLLLLAHLGPVQAGDPYLADYNYHRAYRHFLSSPSPYKTFSSYRSGYSRIDQTPFGYYRFSLGGSYEQQRLHSRGYEQYRVTPGYRIEQETPFDYHLTEVSPRESYLFQPHVPAPPPVTPSPKRTTPAPQNPITGALPGVVPLQQFRPAIRPPADR